MSFLSSLIYSPFSSHVMAIAIGFVFMFGDLALGTRAKRFQKKEDLLRDLFRLFGYGLPIRFLCLPGVSVNRKMAERIDFTVP